MSYADLYVSRQLRPDVLTLPGPGWSVAATDVRRAWDVTVVIIVTTTMVSRVN